MPASHLDIKNNTDDQFVIVQNKILTLINNVLKSIGRKIFMSIDCTIRKQLFFFFALAPALRWIVLNTYNYYYMYLYVLLCFISLNLKIA